MKTAECTCGGNEENGVLCICHLQDMTEAFDYIVIKNNFTPEKLYLASSGGDIGFSTDLEDCITFKFKSDAERSCFNLNETWTMLGWEDKFEVSTVSSEMEIRLQAVRELGVIVFAFMNPCTMKEMLDEICEHYLVPVENAEMVAV